MGVEFDPPGAEQAWVRGGPGGPTELTCGWPAGTREEDGRCGARVAVAYLVGTHAVPFLLPSSREEPRCLLLCEDHDPTRLTERLDRLSAARRKT